MLNVLPIVVFAVVVCLFVVPLVVQRIIEGPVPPTAWAPMACPQGGVVSVVEMYQRLRHPGDPRSFMCQTSMPDVTMAEVMTDTRLPIVGMYDINGPGLVANKTITPTEHPCVWNVTVEYA